MNYNGGFVYDFIPLEDEILFKSEAVIAGTGMFPLLRNGRPTTAPGQYSIANPLADAIHVIAHINVGIPDPDFGPQK